MARTGIFAVSRVATALVVAACSHDVVLPDQVALSDYASADAGVDAGGATTADAARHVCGDGGVTVDGGDAACGTAPRAAPCDLSGFWAVRETAYLLDQVFQTVQVSSNWYLYEVVQTGSLFTLTASLDCGVHVTGSATIDYPPATERALIWANAEDGSDPTNGGLARQGSSSRTSDGCAVTLSPWYFVRGCESSYLPASFAADVALETLPPLPSVTDPVNGNVFPAGATDPTTTGIPGMGTVVSGLVPGLRYSAQRSTTSFATTTDLPAGAQTLVIPGLFDVQENVLKVTDCGSGCSLLTSLATPSASLPPHATWQFLGATLGAAAAVVVAAPRTDIDLDLQTCANVQLLLPHDGTPPG